VRHASLAMLVNQSTSNMSVSDGMNHVVLPVFRHIVITAYLMSATELARRCRSSKSLVTCVNRWLELAVGLLSNFHTD